MKLTHTHIAKIVYGLEPATFEDRVDGLCVMPWNQAEIDHPVEYAEALKKAASIQISDNPNIELLRMLGGERLTGEMGSFTWFWGSDWFVETRFGNFHWKDPDYSNGDNTMTFFDGTIEDFCHQLNLPYGRDKGMSLISNKCGEQVVLVLPQ